MCGIAGIFNLKSAPAPREDELARMVHALHHRGPDGNGFYIDDRMALGHARLSIIDLAGGAQPIRNEDGTVQVILNGEIFNYRELRRQLQQQGHRFYTDSDTEVIVHLYEEHGERFVEHLNGQFAIALWDRTRRQLLLARDRAGIRPLFYTHAKGRLLFASEVKGLFAHPDVPRRLSTRGLAESFTFWAPLESSSVFEGVHSLPPGHLMVLGDGGERIQRYWDWTFPTKVDRALRANTCAEELRELLIDAVRLNLRADVPVGAYLSGGLDSSIITALIRNHTNTPLRTFSLTFDDAEFDESAQQRELVDYLGTEHSSLRVTRTDIADAFPRTVWHAENVLLRTAAAPMMLLAGHVRAAGYKVVLTGEGADEVFGGYDLFKEAKVRRFAARQPQSAWRPRLLERLYPYLKDSPVAGRAMSQRFFSEGADQVHEPWFAHLPRIATTRRILRFLRPEVQREAMDWDALSALRSTLPPDIDRWLPMGRDQYVEAHTLLSGYLLSSQGDRVAMANSIEARVPFLDHRVIEFANRLPPQFKLSGLTEKAILRQSMRGELPPAVAARAKQPYRAPDSSSFFLGGKPVAYVRELLSASRLDEAGLFDPALVQRLVDKCAAGRAIGFGDNMAFVGILSTMLLHEQFVRATGVCEPAVLTPVAA